MSLPPATVKIKRKATDDPVEFLRIHESGGSGKRQRQDTGYIFSRQSITNDSTASQSSSPAPRKIAQLPQPTSSSLRQAGSASISQNATQTVPPTNATPFSSLNSQPRRFHISRSAIASGNTNADPSGSRKRKVEPTVFVERRIRPKSADGTPGGSTTPEESGGQNVKIPEATGIPKEDIQTPEVRKQKKPGKSSRITTPVRSVTPPKSSPAPLRNVLLPNGSMIPWDVTSDQLAAEMQAYTLQEIGKSIAASEAPKPSPVYSRIKSPSKFKPKKPALRYLERHPEHKIEASMQVDEEEYIVEDMDDDSEYIIETYVRVPAEAVEGAEAAHKNIGLLVLDSQPDIDEFYREDEESEEEEDDEDEDENAENHYTADYPDEEVDSDDEFDRNAYNYRNHNASDLEEFDEDDATFSDDDSEATKYPWLNKPWLKKPTGTIMDDSD
ncbi:hypothetical protein IFR04_004989 [Cadophora malorum]|uniref:Transcription factor Iwr1 domain-containing protein n=1 Tax=Cadophora malorum TaxID=108018 RepID=A0A8H7WBP4_9HELO|nr:hypothetical protein IFR04_004989 [Cadophora malorum]